MSVHDFIRLSYTTKDYIYIPTLYTRVFLEKQTNKQTNKQTKTKTKTNKKKHGFLIFYRATLSFGVFGVKNTTYNFFLSISMHI